MGILEAVLSDYMNNLPKRYSVSVEGDSENTNFDISVIGTAKGANCYISGGLIVADFWQWEHGDLVDLRSVEYTDIQKLKTSLARIR